ncbi:hypothetical protein MTR67_014245 [Solanum verrucosum]|uniref:Uncharacterized protein n=1 Tax=Solanum verrucosum TaxID=315347 RepID=A0AAF0TPJ0_SOLVR|nr:hypothetical protein MTR67_014245 [Solanum verrucosum]
MTLLITVINSGRFIGIQSVELYTLFPFLQELALSDEEHTFHGSCHLCLAAAHFDFNRKATLVDGEFSKCMTMTIQSQFSHFHSFALPTEMSF